MVPAYFGISVEASGCFDEGEDLHYRFPANARTHPVLGNYTTGEHNPKLVLFCAPVTRSGVFAGTKPPVSLFSEKGWYNGRQYTLLYLQQPNSIPIRSILSSGPVWAILLASFGRTWTFNTLLHIVQWYYNDEVSNRSKINDDFKLVGIHSKRRNHTSQLSVQPWRERKKTLVLSEATLI